MFLRRRVADGIRHIDRRRARRDRHAEHADEIVLRGARRVHRGELDIGREARRLLDRRLGHRHDLVLILAVLVLEMDRAAADEGVDARLLGGAQRLDGRLDIDLHGAGEAADGDALRALGDLPHRVEVAGGGDREARLDDVHAEADERVRDFQFLVDGHARARRLLAIAQRRVEDIDALSGVDSPGVGTIDGWGSFPLVLMGGILSSFAAGQVFNLSCTNLCYWTRPVPGPRKVAAKENARVRCRYMPLYSASFPHCRPDATRKNPPQ